MTSEMEKKASEVLCVNAKADISTIKKSYRRLARKYHPDSNTGADTDKFILITEAYEYLVEHKTPGHNSLLYHKSEKEVSDEEYIRSWMKQYGSVI